MFSRGGSGFEKPSSAQNLTLKMVAEKMKIMLAVAGGLSQQRIAARAPS
jgi:hypothetical protein